MNNFLFQRFRSATVLVIGDVMIDCYLKGKVTRISPEAPVPVMNVLSRDYRLGGAANVALNVQALGAKPILCAVVGGDEKGSLFSDLLAQHQLSNEGIMVLDSRKTTVKYRVVGNNSQMMRIDEEDDSLLQLADAQSFYRKVADLIENHSIDAIIFEDYDKGLLSKDLIQNIVQLAISKNILITVDPKRRNFKYYQNVTMFKPNLKELTEGLYGEAGHLSMEEVERSMRDFANEQNISVLLTTMSEHGVAVYERANDTFSTQPAYRREIADVSGAGDTVISVATLCLVAGVDCQKAAHIANLAGGIVCESAGVVPISAEQLELEIARLDVQ